MGVSKVQKADGTVIMDLTSDTVTANNLLLGETAHGADGEEVTGVVDVVSTDIVADAWNAETRYDPDDVTLKYCIRNEVLYKCLVAHSNIEPPDATYWEQTNVAKELSQLNSDLDNLSYEQGSVIVSIGSTLQISNEVLSHNFVVISVERGGYGDFKIIPKILIQANMVKGDLIFFNGAGAWWVINISATGLITVNSSSTSTYDPIIDVHGIL